MRATDFASSLIPDVHYAISKSTTWRAEYVYDCPAGYHWADTKEALDMVDTQARATSRADTLELLFAVWLGRIFLSREAPSKVQICRFPQDWRL